MHGASRNYRYVWDVSCVQVHVKLIPFGNNSGAGDTYLYLCESYWFDNFGIFTEGNLLLYCISNLPLAVTNEGREAIKKIFGAVAGDSKYQQKTGPDNSLARSKFLAPLPETPVYKIGELHAIFYL